MSATKTENFRTLFLRKRTRKDGSLISVKEMASRTGFTRAWIYMLMDGQFNEIPDESVRKLAKGIGSTQREVREALDQSAAEA